MISRLFKRKDRDPGTHQSASLPPALIPPDRPLPYSWILSRRLAVGPMPSSPAHWQQLEDAGLFARFSCCYPNEQGPAAVPAHWVSDGLPLPDHRRQERLELATLVKVLKRVEGLLSEGSPLYLHCLAGIERSPLVAVGLTALERDLSLFDALDWVRRCHPPAKPIVSHLELLEQLLSSRG